MSSKYNFFILFVFLFYDYPLRLEPPVLLEGEGLELLLGVLIELLERVRFGVVALGVDVRGVVVVLSLFGVVGLVFEGVVILGLGVLVLGVLVRVLGVVSVRALVFEF